MALMLVHEPPHRPERPERPERRWPRVPLAPFAWAALVASFLALAATLDGFAGYLVLLAMIVVCSRGLSRWCSRHSWEGVREHRQ